MFDRYMELFACRVCRERKEASGDKSPCYEIGQYCPHIEHAKVLTMRDIERDKILVKRGEID